MNIQSKRKIKTTIDIVMVILLPLLMSYSLIRETAHSVNGKEYTGSTLMNFGLYLPEYEKDFDSMVWEIQAEN